MATKTHTILNIKKATVTLGTDEYADAVTSAALLNTVESTSWEPISGNRQDAQGTPAHTVALDFGQDLSSATSLHAVLLKNFDKVMSVSIKPSGGVTGPEIAASVLIGLVSQAGGGRGVATAQCVLTVQGQPTIKDAAGVVLYPPA